MAKIIALHLLLILLLPFIWHIIKQQEQAAQHAATAEPSAVLTESEQKYYDTIFSYVMENTPPDGTYSWQQNTSSGTLRAGDRFTSKSKSLCRKYTEAFNINGHKGTAEGYGCRRADEDNEGSWCRLHEGNVLTCALEQPQDFLGWISREGNDNLR